MQPRAWMLVRAPMRRRILEAEVEATAEIQRSRSGPASPAPPKAKAAMAPKASSCRRHGPIHVAGGRGSELGVDLAHRLLVLLRDEAGAAGGGLAKDPGKKFWPGDAKFGIFWCFFFEIGSALRKLSGPMGPDRLSYRGPVLLAEKHSAETPLLSGGYYSAKSMNIPQQQDPHYRGSS